MQPGSNLLQTKPMNRIDAQLKLAQSEKRVALMTHAVVGYPTIATSLKLVKACIEAGSDCIELQIPFSDPIADGATIMHASEIALTQKVGAKEAFTMASKITSQTAIPVVIMAYYNSVFRYGVEQFCNDAAKSGVSGLIVPDIPPEEEVHEHFMTTSEKHGLYAIRVMAPSSSNERLDINAKGAQGFVYCISRYGITGAKDQLDMRLAPYLANVRKHFIVPIAVGFGISKPEHITQLKGICDMTVVGSAIIDTFDHEQSESTGIVAVSQLIKSLRKAGEL